MSSISKAKSVQGSILPDELSVEDADAGVESKGRMDLLPLDVGAGGRENTILVDGISVAPDRKIGALLQGSREDAGNSGDGANGQEDK
jgi:hypothetical protein